MMNCIFNGDEGWEYMQAGGRLNDSGSSLMEQGEG